MPSSLSLGVHSMAGEARPAGPLSTREPADNGTPLIDQFAPKKAIHREFRGPGALHEAPRFLPGEFSR